MNSFFHLLFVLNENIELKKIFINYYYLPFHTTIDYSIFFYSDGKDWIIAL
jgi:hypothetical protein